MRGALHRLGEACALVAWSLAVARGAAAQAIAPIVAPRVDGQAWTRAESAKLGRELDALLAHSPALRGAHVGAYAVDTRTGATLYAHAADDAFAPASTLKLLVGSVALERLGPAYRFSTQALLAERRLVVRASGDPTLARADLDSLRDALGQATVATIDDVAIDDSRYDRAPYPAGWTWDDFSYDYAAPVSAATIDENVETFSVGGGANVGDAVGLADGGGGATSAAGPLPGCDAQRPGLRFVATTVAAGTAPTIDTRTVAPGCTEIFGTLAVGKTASVDVAVRDPQAFFANAVRQTLLRAGSPRLASGAGTGQLQGSAFASAVTSAGVVVWTHDSAPLRVWLGPRFWIPSDNLFGELLLKEIGFVTSGAPGTTVKGIAAEKLWLRSIGVDTASVTLADGCGMSQYDRISPKTLVAILQHDWNGENRQLVLDSLPVGGARGTIEGIAGTVAAGRVFAKTGSMMHVRGLAGYLAPRRHGAVTFAFNVDDWNGNDAALAAVRAQFVARIVGD